MPTTPQWLRTFGAAARILLVMTVLLGVLYPLAMTGAGQLLFPHQANGSPLEVDGRVVGSELLGQNFEGDEWFHPRPSAAGDDGYDGSASSASNLGPNDEGLTEEIGARRTAVAQANGVAEADVPPDAVTTSGSGLDPHISPAYAAIQVDRVAQARELDAEAVRELVAEHTRGRDLGFIGDPAVNVVTLNAALAEASG